MTINFACLPRETGKARVLEIDLRRVEANLSTDEEETLSNKYMQKEILHTNRKSCIVEIVRKDNAVVSRRKERARRCYEVDCVKVKIEQEGEVSCGKVCEEGLPKVNLE